MSAALAGGMKMTGNQTRDGQTLQFDREVVGFFRKNFVSKQLKKKKSENISGHFLLPSYNSYIYH